MISWNELKESVSAVFRQWSGPQTRDLVLHPSEFGLGKLPARLMPEKTTDMVCGFCSTGCGLKIHLRNEEAVNLSPTTNYPVNLGMACPKGWEALTPLKAPDRATSPYYRQVDGTLEPIEWDTALRMFVTTFKDIQKKYGPDSLAFLSTGQICTEEMALLGAVAKFGMGIRHGDGNTRQCMATSVVAYKQSFGFDAPPYTYKDFEESDVLVFIGANPCIAHPILWERVCRNKNKPDIIVVDPRRTETAMQATKHFALRPKSDLTLFYGIAHILIAKNWIDEKYIQEHTLQFEEFKAHVESFSSDRVSRDTGLTPDQLQDFAEAIHRGQRVSFWWTMGVNQGHEATRTAQAIINLALMTGNIGRPGTGANSITGQTNAMGSRLFSNTTNLLGGHDFLNPAHREKISGLLNIPVDRIPTQNSWAYNEIIDGIERGVIKGLWVIATNPAHSWISRAPFKDVLKKLEFLVVQDMYHSTETAQLADLILPAAAWGEKEGTVINSERRIGLYKRVAKAPGKALADFYIFKLLADYWGCGDLFDAWDSPEAVFQILKRVSEGTPCDFTGVADYKMIDGNGGIQWPCPPGTADENGLLADNERRLFTDGRFYHQDGKARFHFEDVRPIYEPTDKDYPFILLTGRGTSAQWHTQTRTKKSAVLNKMAPKELYVEIHPADAEKKQVKDGHWVKVISRRGQTRARSWVTPTVGKGQVFLPMHYEGTNLLTYPIFDPYSKQPSYKYAAVDVVPL
jgi:anaerobic selenocysteine-containing dehydrogenase